MFLFEFAMEPLITSAQNGYHWKALLLLNISVMVSITQKNVPTHKEWFKVDPIWVHGDVVLCNMESTLDQCGAIKTFIFLGFNPVQIHNKLVAAYGENALIIPRVREWVRRFREDPGTPIRDKKRSGRPKARGTVQDRILQVLQDDRHVTQRQIAAETNTPKTTVHRVLVKDLKMQKLAPKFVPRILTNDQKAERLRISTMNLQRIQGQPGFLSKVVTTNESWVFSYDPRSKQADCQWTPSGEPRPTKALRARSTKKTMLVLFFDQEGVVWEEFVDQGTVTTEVYIQILRRFREAMHRKRPAVWPDFVLLQDNAPVHTSLMAADYFHRVNQELLPHPPYSPDLAKCDFWAFPAMKKVLRGWRFQSIDDVKTEVHRLLRLTPKDDFHKTMESLVHRYELCVRAGGGYFEGQGKCGLETEEQ